MSEQFFKWALSVLALVALIDIGSMLLLRPPPSAADKELALARQQADAELQERRHKSPQYRLERARIILDRQFPGECSVKARLIYLPNGDVSARCNYDETFVVDPTLAFAMRCAGATKLGIAACLIP